MIQMPDKRKPELIDIVAPVLAVVMALWAFLLIVNSCNCLGG